VQRSYLPNAGGESLPTAVYLILFRDVVGREPHAIVWSETEYVPEEGRESGSIVVVGSPNRRCTSIVSRRSIGWRRKWSSLQKQKVDGAIEPDDIADQSKALVTAQTVILTKFTIKRDKISTIWDRPLIEMPEQILHRIVSTSVQGHFLVGLHWAKCRNSGMTTRGGSKLGHGGQRDKTPTATRIGGTGLSSIEATKEPPSCSSSRRTKSAATDGTKSESSRRTHGALIY
jgi:hypothetical protein